MVQTIPELIASQACLRMNRMIEKEPLPCSIAIVSISIPPLTFFLNLGSPSEDQIIGTPGNGCNQGGATPSVNIIIGLKPIQLL